MKKYFLFAVIAIIFSFGAFSQSIDLPTLEGLKKQLGSLKDTALVNRLDLISYNFLITNPALGASDSIFHYASEALKLAKKINYKKGMADALNKMASSQNVKGFVLKMANQNDSAVRAQQRKYLLAAIEIAKEIDDDDALGKAFYVWPPESKNDTTDYMKKSVPYFNKAGNKKMEGEACTWIAEGYFYKGYYENAIEYCQRGLALNREMVNAANTKEELVWREYLYQQSLSDMADLYKTAGDYQSSLEYFEIANRFGIERNTGWTMEDRKAEVFRLTGQYDSSFYYLRISGDTANNWTKRDIAATYITAKKYDSALTLLKHIEPGFRKMNIRGNLLPVLFYTGSAFAGKKDFKNALPYAREAISNAEYLGRRPDMMDGYELISRIHHQLGNSDSAYYYLNKYIILKDSIQNRQFLFRINNYKKAAIDIKKEAQLSILDKDNKLKTAQLKKEEQLKKFLVFGLIGLLLTGFFVFRWLTLKQKNEKLNNEKIQTELQQRTIELEMQALRAQMNPHFIFNCLSSINRFIFINETKTASDYLTRFSRLIRMVLLNSQKKLIALEDELEMLRLYLDMERMRFRNKFDYHITTTNAVESSPIFIPPLLLQPFCENAIWHGLMHLPDRQEGKDEPGHLNIELYEEENILHCIITDNGVGREKAESFKSKSAEKDKSLGLKITRERLSLLNQGTTGGTFYEIEDVTDEQGNAAGTRVKLQIHYKESVEEFV